ncbi:MAG: FMN-binding protein [Planctomycetota bacterium]|jgi:electron transport complex protein RnfG
MSDQSSSSQEMVSAEPVAAKMIIVLALAGLLSGLAIVCVYVLTLPLIERNRAEALRAAVYKVVPGSVSMQGLSIKDGNLAPDSEAPSLYAAYGENAEFMGYAIPGEGAGFQDTIRLLYGFRPGERVIIGMEILESKETPGLGDKIFKDEDFQANFEALAVEPEILVVKNGSKEKAHEIDGISGATISCKAVAKILNSGNSQWLDRLPEPGKEPALQVPSKEEREH